MRLRAFAPSRGRSSSGTALLLQELKAAGQTVAVVGEEVNDGPALAAGHGSIAVVFDFAHFIRAGKGVIDRDLPPIRPAPWFVWSGQV